MESGQNLDSFPSFCPKQRKNLDMRLLFLFLFIQLMAHTIRFPALKY